MSCLTRFDTLTWCQGNLSYSPYITTRMLTSKRKSEFMHLTSSWIFHGGVWMKQSFGLCSSKSLWNQQGWNIHLPIWVWLRLSLRWELNMYVIEAGQRVRSRATGRSLIPNHCFWTSKIWIHRASITDNEKCHSKNSNYPKAIIYNKFCLENASFYSL